MERDEDYLLLSQLTQAGYCPRRAALIMCDQIWQESVDTAKGRAEHQRVHTQRVERRGTDLKLFEFDVVSHKLWLKGKCDCVEAAADPNGCLIPAAEFPVRLYPVEFKHGKVRAEREYEIQLCAQAMCLEEMYHTEIPEGAIFYISSHRRYPVQLDQTLRNLVQETAGALRELQNGWNLPAPEYGAKCVKCSLRERCMPQLQRSAKDYCSRLARAAEEVEPL